MVVDWQLASTYVVLASTAHHQLSSTLAFGASTSAQPTTHTWQHPTLRRYKCKIDAAFSSQFNRTSIGICVRDSDSTFFFAKTVIYPCMVSIDVAEALGLHSALQWLSDMQMDGVDFETNLKLTSDAFLSTRNDTSEFGSIISSCRLLFSSFFSNFRVEFVRRQANAVAHAFAR